METPPTPTSKTRSALRRTRPWILAIGALLLLWMALAVALVVLTTEYTRQTTMIGVPFWKACSQNLLFYLVSAYVATHTYVGIKLIQLARCCSQPTPNAGQAFVAFWKSNLRAHLLLWALLAVVIVSTYLLAR